MTNGTVFVISAPSGAGKTSLLSKLVELIPKLKISISYTTRLPRLGEENGVHYHFITVSKFKSMILANNFLEHAKVHSHYYGTSYLDLSEQLKQGMDVILEIDWQGARQVRQIFSKSKTIFIMPPSIETLRRRLINRGQDEISVIEQRLINALEEIRHHSEFDYVVINDYFTAAVEALYTIITACRQNKELQLQPYGALFIINNKGNV